MYPDVRVDDKLLPGKSHAVIWDLTILEGVFRYSHIHHDLCSCPRNLFNVKLFHLKLQETLVDISGLPFCATDCNILSGGELFGSILSSYKTRNAELARYDRSVAGAPPFVSDDGCCYFHDRLPVRVGHGSNEHFALLELTDICAVLDYVCCPLADLGPHSLPGNKDLC